MTVLAKPLPDARPGAGPAEARSLASHDARHPGTGPDASATTEQLLRQREDLPAGSPDRAALRDVVIEANLPMAKRLARRYAGRGEPLDDLTQVAALALVKAVDGYDTSRPTLFVSYAVPTIVGALKRHFRDTAWALRVPRATQELVLAVRASSAELGQRHSRAPTPADLADHLHVKVDDVLTAGAASHAYRPDSLDASLSRDGIPGPDLNDALGAIDPGFAEIDQRLMVAALMRTLPTRERRILTMRFYDEMTQARVAADIGLSQMHVSRLLRKSLAQLRIGLTMSGAESGVGPRSAGDPGGPIRSSTHS